jgi:formamidopyrimidine-DNA glycosylase
MPELAEVEYYRRQWDPGIGHLVNAVDLHSKAIVFKGCDVKMLQRRLKGAHLTSSEASGKQMLFRFEPDVWLGIHLGMTGELRCEDAAYAPGKHDHLVLRQEKHAFVFRDFRMLGLVRFFEGANRPPWWASRAPAILSPRFTQDAVAKFLARRGRAPIKAVLLMQERFPGVGNWMADEILWRAEIHPKQPAGSLPPEEIKTLWKECRWVCRRALKIIGVNFSEPPDTWLFPHRWRDGGHCPKTGAKLVREPIGGRTTCWSPGRQKLRKVRSVR